MRWTLSVQERLDKNTMADPNSGCWLWCAAVTAAGYGVIWCDGSLKLAHRVSYEKSRGAIPHGLQLDHKCRTRCCINPYHLEPVTNLENSIRGWAARGLKTHCKRGHAYSDHSYTNPQGKRNCKECQRVAWKVWTQRKKTNAKV